MSSTQKKGGDSDAPKNKNFLWKIVEFLWLIVRFWWTIVSPP